MSSNVIRSSNIGFANYVKSRIMSADPKFREDPYYMFFLLLVKEMIEMLRSESTYYRKAGKAQGLTPKILKDITKEFLIRYNTAFSAFKNLRGTSMYFQAIKKNLMAFIRQKGPPTLFVTLSSAEFQWDEMIQKIYETTTGHKVSLDFIKSQSQAWKTKLVSENVVQSTHHFSKRVSKLISLFTKDSPFWHNGIMYLVSDFFYRIEFQVRMYFSKIILMTKFFFLQARGAPHLHSMLWLRGPNGQKPPTMWTEAEGEHIDIEKVAANISSFAGAFIHGSTDDASCKNHETFMTNCQHCQDLKICVEQFQTHSCRFTCFKKKKFLRILPTEGFGRLDGKNRSTELLVKVCRFKFPKNVCDESIFLHIFPADYPKELLKKAKDDYMKIRKYLLRFSHEMVDMDPKKIEKFKSLSFYEFLYEVGMFEEGQDSSNLRFQQKAKERYLTALRSDIKSSGILLIKRSTKDLFTNNFNKVIVINLSPELAKKKVLLGSY